MVRHVSLRCRVDHPMKTSFTLNVRSTFAALALAPLLVCVGPVAAESGSGYLSRPEVRTFIDALQAEHGLELEEVERILGDAQYQAAVVRLLGSTPSQSLPPVRSYPAYRSKFLSEARIAAGVQYWETYDTHLRRAEVEFGVPADIILGILGVETAFGRNTGSFRVVDALATIAFDGLRRQDYFREELREFLLLAREIGVDALTVRGSYAGAMGLPQFMPSSYRRYAVDFDRDGLVDLVGSPADAIGSVASYLKAYGWTADEVPVVRVQLPSGSEGDLVSGLERTREVDKLQQAGVKFATAGLPPGPCSIVELPAPGRASKYLAGFGNFEAITRYNRSTFYAAAVIELADAIHVARKRRIVAGSAPTLATATTAKCDSCSLISPIHTSAR
jgi:membrane-bound lytic murein transglycosylase B